MNIKVVKYPPKETWNELQKRSILDKSKLDDVVSAIVNDVKLNGDKALHNYGEKFDSVALESFLVTKEEFQEAKTLVDESLKEAMSQAKRNLFIFHSAQIQELGKVNITSGVTCWQKQIPIDKIGLYIPGGSAPLFSTVLMLAVPADIAGCREIILCTPPNKEGKVNPAVLYAAQLAGVHKVFKIGGAQAIAAMAYGTESVPKVYKIFGPGNQFVTTAKQIVGQKDVAIDMPAGPSEVEVLADERADASFVAADLLSQAEHGKDSQSILVTNSLQLLKDVQTQLEEQLPQLSRKEIAEASLVNNGRLILMHDMAEAVEFTNDYAPEHLIISARNEDDLADCIINAGSVFIGKYATESAGDYVSGTNHTLPTNGYAKMYNGVNMDSFMRKITFQKISRDGLSVLGNAIEIMAAHEGLTAHKNAVTLRLNAEWERKDEDF